MEWDRGSVFSSAQNLQAAAPAGGDAAAGAFAQADAVRSTRDFIRTFRRDGVFVYREALLQNYNNKHHHLEIDLADLKLGTTAVHDAVVAKPNDVLALMEEGAREALQSLIEETEVAPAIQILFSGDIAPTLIREVTAAEMNKLILVPGIVINAARTRPRASHVVIRCQNCGDEQTLRLPPGFGGIQLPRTCRARQANAANGGAPPLSDGTDCPVDPFTIIADKSRYVNQQSLKLQETPESVPTGEMPRHMQLIVERSLADRTAPGTRVSVIGIVSVSTSEGGRGGNAASQRAGAVAIRTPYLRVIGVMAHEAGAGRAGTTFTPEEEASIRRLSRQPALYERLAESIAPSISGDYTADIKKAILCLLLAGSRKVLPDGTRLRGDINVLMLGDPSTAKSQFLKFVEKVAPVGVYTSGKGSSAAGLTASVIRDSKGEFFLEGGAMVLADGGVVCIDEFDKMREEDRVAIHEAMEQQTISVAKAGITTILNSRAAVLAAANPVFGRYDDTRSAADNIDLLPTILSRFDLIFIVRDIRNERRDQEIARHVMRVHMSAGSEDPGAAADGDLAVGAVGGGVGGGSSASDSATGEVDIATLKKYISYARTKVAPRLTPEAATALQAAYVQIRAAAKSREADARVAALASSEDHGVIPITVRQLEALVRLTEAVAKASLSVEANEAHVQEALRLFKVSTLNAAASGLNTLEASMDADTRKRVQLIEQRIQRLVPLGGAAPTSRVKEALLRGGFSEGEVNMAIKVLERRDEISLQNERKTLRRAK